MSHEQSQGSMGDESSLLLDNMFSSQLHVDHGERRSVSNTDLSAPEPAEKTRQAPVVLSTQSAAARKLGTQQLIPRNLAMPSRPKNRHHTTVVTLPVSLEAQKRVQGLNRDLSWEDYDSDGDGFSLRRNQRNKSYRAAVTSLDMEVMTKQDLLQPVSEERSLSPKPALSPGRKRTLGRKRNQRYGGSFKDDPCFYQEIKERGLQSNHLGAEDEDAPQAGTPEDQGIVVKSYRPAHLTWSQLPQVQEMGILETISPEERKRQEAIFELMTSEYSYQHSLSILVRHFKASDALKKTMTMTEHHHLFSNISVIQQVSKRFFEDLERRHQRSPVIQDISDIVQDHATNRFDPYIVYCSNETFQQRTLQKLLASNAAFKELVKKIETSAECGGLPMFSFLILPMQRVTRLPLLMDTICQKTTKQTSEYYAARWALKAISLLVKQCNDGARRMEHTEQMYTIQKQMEFGKIKPFPLVSASRWLLKRGELAVSTDDHSIFWKAFSQKSYYLFLFNDVLIVTRKKSEESYVVFDYATLQNVEVEEEQADSKLLLRLVMKPNSEGRCEQMALLAENKVDRARWVTALHRHKQQGRSWNTDDDLPQYEATKAYMPKEPDELSLQQAEVVLVLKEVEGWYYGDRMRDGETGWFPASCVKQITNRTAIESNIQRMERLRKETNV
ncbi:rho guanine nucleotide exchange factor 16 [Brachyhypopomus gauderio]|uniref:rho guanine nucleotide exchange factor 16 n=1 Tax=Brachyhypopomus gauderio TaxID=698409 RepID=UPI004040EE3F